MRHTQTKSKKSLLTAIAVHVHYTRLLEGRGVRGKHHIMCNSISEKNGNTTFCKVPAQFYSNSYCTRRVRAGRRPTQEFRGPRLIFSRFNSNDKFGYYLQYRYILLAFILNLFLRL